MKNFTWLLMLLIACFATTINAQDEEDNFKPTPVPREVLEIDNCLPAIVKSAYTINFTSGIKGYIEFRVNPKGKVSYQQIGTRNMLQAIPENGVFVLPNLRSDTAYEVFVPNSCGKPELTKVINTKSQKGKKDMVEVSPELFDALNFFSTGKAKKPFNDFLGELRDISLFEKISFYQGYLLNGRAIKDGDIPFRATGGGGGGGDDDEDDEELGCNCQTVHTSQIAVPGTAVGNPLGNIEAVHTASGVSGNPKVNLGGTNAHWWWGNSSAGAAKWHYVWSEGWKARKNQSLGASMGSLAGATSDVTINRSSLSYLMFCIDGSIGVPMYCGDCTKDLKLNYQYDTKMRAFAQIHNGGGGDKKSFTTVQDYAVVTLKKGYDAENVTVLAAGDAQVASSCDQLVNEGFWLNILDIATTVGQIVLAGQPTADNITSISEGIDDMITNPLHSYDDDCNGDVELSQPLLGGQESVEFHSNEAVIIDLFSFSNLKTGGMRSWFTHGGINSDFLLSGFLSGGYNADKEDAHCCHEQLGNWVLSSYGGPQSEADLKTLVGQQFVATNNINPLAWSLPIGAGGVVQIPTDYGYDAVDIIDCSEIVDDPDGPGKKGSEKP